MRILFFVVFNAVGLFLLAQSPGLEGKIIDQSTGELMPFANVIITLPDQEKIIAGVTTNEEGKFLFNDIDEGSYELKVNFMGYEEYTRAIEITPGKRNIGSINMVPKTTALEEVVIEDDPKLFTPTMDGLSVDPKQNIAQLGGSVLDVLQNVPSVRVGQDGSISLRGASSTNVLINGRNSALSGSLETIAASAVDEIVINHNPGAKYDAQGQGGLVDIKLKQGTDESELGLSGRASITYGNRGRYNGSVGLTNEWKKIKVFGSYDRRGDYDGETGFTNRNNYEAGVITRQRDHSGGFENSNSINSGISFYPNKKNVFDYSLVIGFEDENQYNNIYNRQFNVNEELQRSTYRRSDEVEDEFTLENALSWTYNFDKEGASLMIQGTRSSNEEIQNEIYRAYNYLNEDLDSPLSQQRAETDAASSVTVGQIDLVYPFTSKSNLEAGLKTTIRNIDNDFVLETFNESTDEYETNLEATNHFLYDEQVYAAYASFKTLLDKWEYYGGLRAEQTMVDTRLVRTNETNDQRYLSFFPSAKVLYWLDEKNSIRATYSRRIDRPRSYHLNPFVDVSDSLNIFKGNPNMKPEFISSFELGHNVDFKEFSLTSTIFYRYIKNQRDWVTRSSSEGYAFRGPANLDYGNNLGLEVITIGDITDWWEINASIMVFYADIAGQIDGIDYSNSNITTNAQFNSNFLLPWQTKAQLTFEYEGPEAEAQGTEKANYNFDFGLRKDVFKEAGYVSFNVRDIFNTRRRREQSSGPGFEQELESNWQSRVFQVGLGYNF